MPKFEVVSEYKPAGDQPQAIEALANGVEMGLQEQTLLGVTGSGKTFTMAKAIEKRSSGPPWCWPTTRPWPPSCAPSSRSSSPTTRWSISSPTTTTTSPEAYIPHTDTYHREGRRGQRGDRPAAAVRHLPPCWSGGT